MSLEAGADRQKVARGLWLALLAAAALIGWRAGGGEAAAEHAPDDTIWVELVLPAVFFALCPWWMRGHPLDFGPLRKWIDTDHGSGTYDRWLWAIRPLLLLGAAALAAAAACAFNGWRTGAPAGAYVIAGSFLSAALGIALCWAILRWQGHKLE